MEVRQQDLTTGINTCIIRQSSEGGMIIPKRAASTDGMVYGGCLVQLVLDEIEYYTMASALYTLRVQS